MRPVELLYEDSYDLDNSIYFILSEALRWTVPAARWPIPKEQGSA